MVFSLRWTHFSVVRLEWHSVCWACVAASMAMLPSWWLLFSMSFHYENNVAISLSNGQKSGYILYTNIFLLLYFWPELKSFSSSKVSFVFLKCLEEKKYDKGKQNPYPNKNESNINIKCILSSLYLIYLTNLWRIRYK